MTGKYWVVIVNDNRFVSISSFDNIEDTVKFLIAYSKLEHSAKVRSFVFSGEKLAISSGPWRYLYNADQSTKVPLFDAPLEAGIVADPDDCLVNNEVVNEDKRYTIVTKQIPFIEEMKYPELDDIDDAVDPAS
jgi:hypothetical protein